MATWVGVATLAAACGGGAAAVAPLTATADPAGHQVTYTITTTGNLTGNVRYMNSDPPSQAAYDANSSQYMTTVSATFTGGQPLVYSSTLANPNQWAIVTASGGCHWPDCGSGSTAGTALRDRRGRAGCGDPKRHNRGDLLDATLVTRSAGPTMR